jgi:hypothetical protein
MSEARVERVLQTAAWVVFGLNALLLLVLSLLPMPDVDAVPGRAPRVVVGS